MSQDSINYILERINRVKNLTNQIMVHLDPYFQIPFRYRDYEEHLTENQMAIVDRNNRLIDNLMEKIYGKYRELCRGSSAFKQSPLGTAVNHLQKLHFKIYEELWGGYRLYDDIAVENKLRDFHQFVNSIQLHYVPRSPQL